MTLSLFRFFSFASHARSDLRACVALSLVRRAALFSTSRGLKGRERKRTQGRARRAHVLSFSSESESEAAAVQPTFFSMLARSARAAAARFQQSLW